MSEYKTFDPRALKRLRDKWAEYVQLPESFMLDQDEVRAIWDYIKDL